MASTTQVAIIGAGPYGLSVAAHLRAQGVPFRIFGQPMFAWRRQMPAGMFLKSEGFAASLSDPEHRYTLPAYCADRRIDHTAPIAIETFIDYGLWFQQHQVPEVEPVEVSQLRRVDGQFELDLATGERLTAQRVVVAVGIGHFAYLPPPLSELPSQLASHTAQHPDLGRFAGQDVVVVGGGQSALETAALLHEHHATVRVMVRKPSIRFHNPPRCGPRPLKERLRGPVAGLGPGWENWLFEHVPLAVHYLPGTTRVRLVRQILGPCGAWWLRDRVDGQVEMLTGCTITGAAAEPGGVRLRFQQEGRGHQELRTDHVIGGTGYRVDINSLRFMDADLRSVVRCLDRAPVLSRRFESSVPGMYFVGLAAAISFGPMFRFVLGANFAAPTVARDVARKGAGRLYRAPVAARDSA
jgi:lysine/ornithine N-monooxygenase